MQIQFANLWYRLQSSFWFVPTLIALLAILFYFASTAIDRVFLYHESAPQWWHYGGGLMARAPFFLSVIAGSMITVSGVVFSITIVVLSLASSQFGPRLIRNFMAVKSNQVVIGTFVATFIYSILVLSNVNATVESRFVPSLSITIAILMSLLSLGVLIFFIHSVSESIQAQNIIFRVRHRYDMKNRLRVICKPFVFEGMVDAAFNMIRQSSQSIAAVSIHLLESIAIVAVQTNRKEDRAALLRHATMVSHGCITKLSEESDREDLKKRYDAVIEICKIEGASI